MVPNNEHDILRQIEDRLGSEDPWFASEFTAGFSAARRRQAARWRLILVLADVTAVLMVVAGLFAGQGWPVLWGLLAAVLLTRIHVVRARDRRNSFTGPT
ncbi:DUF3040 domain-containing protein [Amycolatopsis sp. NPDC026612]|uniref:DUF3040 domain-containing protein n=1 Tax=Amycolatopsis sp. NPDC026612 TaxID=3155466 RepID=UPI0033CFA96E